MKHTYITPAMEMHAINSTMPLLGISQELRTDNGKARESFEILVKEKTDFGDDGNIWDNEW